MNWPCNQLLASSAIFRSKSAKAVPASCLLVACFGSSVSADGCCVTNQHRMISLARRATSTQPPPGKLRLSISVLGSQHRAADTNSRQLWHKISSSVSCLVWLDFCENAHSSTCHPFSPKFAFLQLRLSVAGRLHRLSAAAVHS